MQGVIGLERLDDGPIRVGSVWRETRGMYGKEASEHFEVGELDTPDKIVLRCDGTKGTTGKGVFEFTYIIASTGDHSIVTLDGTINGLTGFAELFGKMIAWIFKKASAKDLDA